MCAGVTYNKKNLERDVLDEPAMLPAKRRGKTSK